VSKRHSFRRISEDAEEIKTFQRFKKTKEEPKKEFERKSDLYRFKSEGIANLKGVVGKPFNEVMRQ
jgi:hypothetical protein